MFLAFLGFGLGMGLIFPLFANLFVNWKPGMLGWFVVACILAGVSIGVFNYWLLKKMLLQRLHRIGEVANAISHNDISKQCTLESHDFIGEMANSFNHMTANLRSMVKRIAGVSEQLNQATDQMTGVIAQTESGVSEQQKGSDRLVETIGALNQSAVQTAEHTDQALSAAKSAESATQSGNRVVQGTVAAITRLADEVEATAKVIQRLHEDTEGIGTVLDVIKDIAEQTNLLALNAAIEAARAGENGRGFAVVADQVRVLASKTQDSTSEIEAMIARLQDGSVKAVEVMRQGQSQAHESVGQANEAGSALEAIAEAVATITQRNQNIAQSAQTQSQQTAEMKDQVASIGRIAQTVAEGAHQTQLTNQSVDEHAQALQTLIREFRF
jgi:methyl-accepting chemotaxis protein